jgi:hypothetical protein
MKFDGRLTSINLGITLFIVLICSNSIQAASYDINNCTDLENIFINDLDGDYTLTGDIDCSGIASFTPIGTIINYFTGSLNGAGYTISNVTINGDINSDDYQGIFAYAEDAHFENLVIDNANVTGRFYPAALLSDGTDDTFENITVQNSTINSQSNSAFIVCNLAVIDDPTSINNCHVNNCTTNGLDGFAAAIAANTSGNITITNVSADGNTFNVDENASGLVLKIFDGVVLDGGTVTDVTINFNDNVANSNLSTLAGAVMQVRNATMRNVSADGVDINANEVNQRACGLIGKVENGGLVEDCHLQDLYVDSIESTAGFINDVVDTSITRDCNAQNLDLNFVRRSAGFVAFVSSGTVENCSLEDINISVKDDDLDPNNTFSGENGIFSHTIRSNGFVKNCHVKNNDDGKRVSLANGVNNNGGLATYVSSGGHLQNSYLENVDVIGNSDANFAGLAYIVNTGGSVSQCYIDDLNANLPDINNLLGAVHYAQNATFQDCYIANSILTSNNNSCGFANFIADNTVTIERCFVANTTLNSGFRDEFINILNTGIMNDVFFETGINPGAINNSGAVGLNSAQMQDLSNFTNFDPNIWQDGDDHPLLINTQSVNNVSSVNNKIVLEHNSLYSQLPRGTLVSHIRLKSDLADQNFTLELVNAEAFNNFYLLNNTLYASTVFNYYHQKAYDLQIRATNPSNQIIEGNFKVNILRSFGEYFSSNPPPVDDNNLPPDNKPAPELDQCSQAINEYLGLADDTAVEFNQLLEIVLRLEDKLAYTNNKSQLQSLLSCDAEMQSESEFIRKTLVQTIGLNKNGRLNFQDLEDFTKRFRKKLNNQDQLTCSNLRYDIDQDCILERSDYTELEKYFYASLKQRNDEDTINKRLNRIRSFKKLEKVLSLI